MTYWDILGKARPITPAEVDELTHEWLGSFFTKFHGYSLFYDEGRVSFTLEYYGVFPKDLDRSVFTRTERLINGELTEVHRYSYGDSPWQPTEEQSRIGFQPAYHLAQPLVLSEQCEESSLSSLVDYINSHKVVFYTGAGLSEAGGVSGMGAFMEQMGIDTSKGADGFITRLLHSPEELVSTFSSFCQSAYYGEPTKGHIAIKEIALNRGMQVFTENFDHLHERSGIRSLRAEEADLSAQIDPDSLSKIEAFFCVCLSYDDRGLLAFYKKLNPQGKIIALNLEQPSCIGSQDMFLSGDAHELLGQINVALNS